MNRQRSRLRFAIVSLLVFIELVALLFIGKLYFRRYFSLNTLDSRVTTKYPTHTYKYFYENEKNVTKTDKPEWLENRAEYRHNSDGLNSMREYSIEKGEGVVRMVALGDSFTYGMYINTKDNWVTSLEKKLNLQECGKRRFEVINLGVPGYDIDYTIERSRLRAKKYDPELFIWFIKNDDFTDSKELSSPIEAQLLKYKTYTIDSYKQVLDLLFKTHDKTVIVREQTQQLEQFVAENKKTRFLFVLPKGSTGYPTIEDEQIETIKNLKKEYAHVDYTFIELKREHTFSPHDYHFNSLGNLLFSNTLTWILKDRYCL